MSIDRRPNIPSIIGRGRVLYYTRIDERHVPRENPTNLPYGIAICDVDGSGIFLFTCEDDWIPVTGSRHASVEDAKGQAAFEFNGVHSTWEEPPE